MKEISKDIDYLNRLNDAQRKAVEATRGPVMVIAGAGSGKTRVLTYRIAHLMNQGIDPFHILALTFTNKAAREMRERIAQIVGSNEAKNLWMGTFHSVFARILRAEGHHLGYPANFSIYDTQDAASVLSKLIKEKGLDKELYKPKSLLARISQFKNNLITPRAYQRNGELQAYDAASKRPETGALYSDYSARCFKAGALDFDDLLLKTYELLNRFPEVLARYQDRFRYLMVDEYQDTNHAQYRIVKALASRYENLCVVGDDAQSIYAFRGANIRNILNFQKDYTDAQVLRLEQNYRSTQHIVGAANSLIKKNRDQLEKNVWTHNPQGTPLSLYRAYSDAEEGAYITRTLFEEKMRKRLRYADFAILYRTNAQSRALEDALRKKNIPYRVYGSLSFYQRKEVKDLIAYLRFLVNPADEEAFARIVNYPKRGIGQTTLNKLSVASRERGLALHTLLGALEAYPLRINAGTRAKLSDFHALIKNLRHKMRQCDAFELTQAVAQQSGLLRELTRDKTPEGISRSENIQELLGGIKGFVEEQSQLADGDPTVVGFLENIALATDRDEQRRGDGDEVALMTVHLAKGLEFPYVFVAGLEENLFPSVLSINSRAELEEERRLFYVALTRAKEQLFLTYALSRFRWGRPVDNEPSRFLFDIDEAYLESSARRQCEVPPPKRGGRDYKHPARPRYSPPSTREAHSPKKPTFASVPKLRAATRPAPAQPLSSLHLGDSVKHSRFGIGTVTELNGEGVDQKATIQFENAGEKKLLLRFAKLKPLK